MFDAGRLLLIKKLRAPLSIAVFVFFCAGYYFYSNSFLQPVWLASFYLEQGNNKRIISVLSPFISSADAPPDIYYLMSTAYRNMDELEKAIAICRKGLEKYPESSKLLNSLGWAYINTAQPAKAKDCFESALQNEPDNGMSYLGMAHVCLLKRKFSRARTHLVRVINTEKDPYYFFLMGETYRFPRDYQKAVKWYRTTLRRFPCSSYGYIGIGYVLT